MDSDKLDDQKFKCEGCGEQIITDGSFTLKITPPKRVPRKAKRLIKQRGTATWGLSKFDKYLLRRVSSRTEQKCVVKCSNCYKQIQMHVFKRLNQPKPKSVGNRNPSSQTTPSSAQTPAPAEGKSARKRKQKTPKDLNAGLMIPASFTPSPYSWKSNQAQAKSPASTSTSNTRHVKLTATQKGQKMAKLSLGSDDEKPGPSGLERLLR